MPADRKRQKNLDPCPADIAYTSSDPSGAPSLAAVTSALSGIAAAWIAAGSVGLLSHPLRHTLTWVALAVAAIAAWRGCVRTRTESIIVLTAVAVGLAMTVSTGQVVNLLAVTLVLAILAGRAGGVDRRLLEITASAVAVLAVYRLAVSTIPSVWVMADLAGTGLGWLAGLIGGKPLWVGASFAGLDFLVLLAALYAGWLLSTAGPTPARAAYAAAGLIGGHLAYLLLLSITADLVAWLPAVVPEPQPDPYIPPDWHAADALRTLLPWNLPAVAAAIHLMVAGAMFRWARWQPVGDGLGPVRAGKAVRSRGGDVRRPGAIGWKRLVLVGLIPLVTTLSWGTSNLNGVKIVANQSGYLDWLKPEYGRYGRASAGMYGMLPELISSLGGRMVLSEDLAASDLADADLLLLIHPDRPWVAGQLERIRQFVVRGGSLLLAVEPRVENDGRRSSFDEVLEPTAMRVRFDTAISQIGQWEHSYQAIAHPATTGIGDRRNRFGMMMGSSIQVRWPAAPLLVGRWGWSDPGSDAVQTGVYHLDQGERLGDLVLAAEQRLGSGRVVVLGDTACLSNQTGVKSFPFVGRLLAYLAGRSTSPQAGWRQILGLLGCVWLLTLVMANPGGTQLAATALVMAVSLAGSQWFGHHATRVIPRSHTLSPSTDTTSLSTKTASPSTDTTSPSTATPSPSTDRPSPSTDTPSPSTDTPSAVKVAYIDGTHLEAFRDESWTPDGVAGLWLTLMRNGYLPLLAPDLASQRLPGADLLILIAPGRKFSAGERSTIRRFVEGGGILIAMVGAEDTRPSRQLLGDFGFSVARSPVRPGENLRQPEPMGCFRGPYLDLGDYQAEMLFYAGWPIRCPTQNAEVLVRGFGDLPVIGAYFLGEGKVVLIGDSGFALNKNLETADGQPIQGRYDNAHFWRWLLSYLSGGQPWTPPPAEPDSATGETSGQEAVP